MYWPDLTMQPGSHINKPTMDLNNMNVIALNLEGTQTGLLALNQ